MTCLVQELAYIMPFHYHALPKKLTYFSSQHKWIKGYSSLKKNSPVKSFTRIHLSCNTIRSYWKELKMIYALLISLWDTFILWSGRAVKLLHSSARCIAICMGMASHRGLWVWVPVGIGMGMDVHIHGYTHTHTMGFLLLAGEWRPWFISSQCQCVVILGYKLQEISSNIVS